MVIGKNQSKTGLTTNTTIYNKKEIYKMTDYWNTYYKTKKKQITVPSQFAAFAIQEFGNQEDTIIIDLELWRWKR